MAEDLLSEIQEFCEESLLPVPQSIIGNDDPQVMQLRALLFRAGQSIAMRHEWERLTFEKVHTTLAQEDQGNIFELTAGATTSTAFRTIKDQTVWDRTDRLTVLPIDAIDWQLVKGTAAVSPRYRYRLLRSRLLMTPTPPAGHEFVFEWVSRWWIQSASGAIKREFTQDTDSFLIERELLKLSLNWRWKKAKGLDYTEEYEEFETRLGEMKAHDTPKEVLYQDHTQAQHRMGIVVPDYSWNVT
jgi:hypothetical protein